MKHAWLKEILGDSYTEELDKKVDDKLGTMFVAKADYDNKVTELGTANTSITDLTGKLKAFDGVDVSKLKQDIGDWETKYNTDISALKLNSALDTALLGAKARDVKAVKPFLNMELIKLDGDKVIGLEEQLKNIKTDKSFLFEDDKKPPYKPNAGDHDDKTNPFAKETFNLTKQGELFKTDPARARELAAVAGVTL